MRARHRAAAIVVAATAALVLVGAPAAAQGDGAPGATDVRFYGHVFTHTAEQPAPANVEFPVGEANYGRGTVHECTSQGEVVVLEAEVNPDRDCEDSYVNSLVLFSTAGFVDVDNRDEFLNEGAYAQLHNERGQVKPVQLDTDGTVTATVHTTVDQHGWLDEGGETACVPPHPEDSPCAYPYWAWDPGVQPDYQVKATLYHAQLGEYQGEAGRKPPIEETLREGDPTVVAKGQTEPQVVVNGVPGVPGAPKVLQMDVDLGAPQVETIPETDDFFLVYKFYSNSSGEKWSYHSWRIWAGEFYPPKFTMPVENAFAVESVIPRFVHGKLAILGVMSSPWGSYDIDPEATTLTVRDKATGEVVTPEAIEAFADYSVAHGGHFEPANVTYVWDYQQDGLAPGEYEVTIEAENFQGSARGVCTGNFTVRPGGQPGPTDAGTCGFQSLTEEQREELEEGAGEQADDGERLSHPDPLPQAAGSVLAGLVGLAAARRP